MMNELLAKRCAIHTISDFVIKSKSKIERVSNWSGAKMCGTPLVFVSFEDKFTPHQIETRSNTHQRKHRLCWRKISSDRRKSASYFAFAARAIRGNRVILYFKFKPIPSWLFPVPIFPKMER